MIDSLASSSTAAATTVEPEPPTPPPEPVLTPRVLVTQPPAPSPRPPDAPAAPQPLYRPKRTRLIAFMNQKGGVGKTTSTVNLGAALADAGYRVLLIDLDPQAHLTLHVGIDPANLDASNYHLLADDDVTAEQVAQRVKDNLWVLPAEVNLAGAETELAPKMIDGRAQRVLQRKCEPWLQSSDTRPDFVFIDCPPSLGLLTINALILAREVFVPMQAHFLALQGLSKLFETVGFIRGGFNPHLRVTGIILCMYDKHTILANEVTADLRAFLDANRGQDVPWRDAHVLNPPVRRNIKLAESPSFGSTIFDYAPGCRGAEDYRQLAEAVVRQTIEADAASA